MNFKKIFFIFFLNVFFLLPSVVFAEVFCIVCENQSKTAGIDLGMDISVPVEYEGSRDDEAFNERIANLDCEVPPTIVEGSCDEYRNLIQGNSSETKSLPNPLTNVSSPSDLIGTIIKALVGIVGAVALVFFILGSTTWLTSAGNPEKVKEGTKTMIFVAAGVLLVFLSYMVINLVLKMLETGSR